jgi:hypothetical protein
MYFQFEAIQPGKYGANVNNFRNAFCSNYTINLNFVVKPPNINRDEKLIVRTRPDLFF